jgi:two-component system chemotaxis sensor kinase CheA
MALPLSALARLEEIPVSRIEASGECQVVQYRGKILPLIRVDQVLPAAMGAHQGSGATSSATIPVLVLNNEGQPFGLVVDRILDIVEQAAQSKAPSTRAGVLCSTVIADRVTELLDVPALWQSAGTSFSQNRLKG